MRMDGFNIVDRSDVGQNLVSIVQELGEDVTFKVEKKELDVDGNEIVIVEEIKCKCCLNNAHSSDNISANTVFKFEGEIVFPENYMIEKFRGQYFTRDSVPDKTYILVSTTEMPYTDILANIEVMECNKKIDIGVIEEAPNPSTGDMERVLRKRHEGVLVFYDTSAKAPQETVAGDIPKTIITITIPAMYPITALDTISSREFMPIGRNYSKPEYGEQWYDVINVDNTYISTMDEISFEGVFVIDVTKII